VGPRECELVQIVVDCYWRLRRIQELEYALYAHGDEQFADAFPNAAPQERHSKILLQTHLTYEKQFRNLHIQEARIDRKRTKALAELSRLQIERATPAATEPSEDFQGFPSEQALFAATSAQGDCGPLCAGSSVAGYIPPHLASHFAPRQQSNENGFDFSNDAASPDLVVGQALAKEAA